MTGVAVVTGAGSGVGRAMVLQLRKAGYEVVLVGRRREPLSETARLAGDERLLVQAVDVGDPEAVNGLQRSVLERYPSVNVVVNAAGTNAPRRALAELDLATFRRIMDTNLQGAYLCAQAFLPGMRAQGSGTIVNIVSDAGLRASAKAGVAYVMSKFGLAGLTEAINAEERHNGIRACAIFPGEIDTPILQLRPNPPSAEARATMLQADDVAACAMLAITLPAHVVVESLLVMPR
ncbi:MAG: SDR family NAD(P)-dependent oxidoreductase [Herpetosiphon sp.]